MAPKVIDLTTARRFVQIQTFEDECKVHGLDVAMTRAVLRAIASAVKCEPEEIGWDTPTVELVRRADRAHWGGWDDVHFVMALEEITGLAIPDNFVLPRLTPLRFFFWKWPGPTTFGEWCQNVVPALEAATECRQDAQELRRIVSKLMSPKSEESTVWHVDGNIVTCNDGHALKLNTRFWS